MGKPANPAPIADPVASAALIRHPAGERIGLHAHAQAQLSVVLEGTMRIGCKGGWWLAPAGRGIWVPAGLEHSASYSERSAFVLIKIAATHAGTLPGDVRSIAVPDLLRALALEIAGPPPVEDAAERALLGQLIVRRIGAGGTVAPFLFLPSGSDPRLLRLTEALRDDPGSTASLDELAAAAGSSRRTMSRLFVAETGMPFARWRDHLRIVAAVDRLVRGVPIQQVAFELGYNSQSSFTTLFTRIVGLPPARYLRQMTASLPMPSLGGAAAGRAIAAQKRGGLAGS